MDATFSLTRLSEDLASLVENGDYEGAEEFLSASLSVHPDLSGYLHFQLGRLYHRWNKLSSAVHHLNYAVDAALGNELFLVQVLDELNSVKKGQRVQRP